MVKDKTDTDGDVSENAGGITDIARKIFLASLGAVSMGERLPKEAMNFILDQAERRKEDVVDRLAVEVSKFLEKLDVSQELKKALQGLEIDLQATLRFSGTGKTGDDFKSGITIVRKPKPVT